MKEVNLIEDTFKVILELFPLAQIIQCVRQSLKSREISWISLQTLITCLKKNNIKEGAALLYILIKEILSDVPSTMDPYDLKGLFHCKRKKKTHLVFLAGLLLAQMLLPINQSSPFSSELVLYDVWLKVIEQKEKFFV